MTSKSEFAGAYKLKPDVLSQRNARVQRRSIEWKNLRYEEVGKRRKIDLENLSPLQEQDLNVTNKSKSYEDKTPVKPKQDQLSKGDVMKQRLIQWKREKEEKKKKEIALKSRNKTFKVAGSITYSDKKLYTDSDKKTFGKTKPEPATAPAKTSNTSRTNSRSQTANSKPANVSNSTVVTRSTRNTSITKDKTRSKVASSPVQPSKLRVTRQTRSSAKLKGSPKPPSYARATRSSNMKNTKAEDAPKARATRGTKPTDFNLNLDKVATERGESFAPSNFAFEAPDNVKSFTFQPLSPASAAGFLSPQEITSTSFFSHEPPVGRSSTPRPKPKTVHSSESSNPSDEEVGVKSTRRQTRSRSSKTTNSSGSECETSAGITVLEKTQTYPTEEGEEKEEPTDDTEKTQTYPTKEEQKEEPTDDTEKTQTYPTKEEQKEEQTDDIEKTREPTDDTERTQTYPTKEEQKEEQTDDIEKTRKPTDDTEKTQTYPTKEEQKEKPTDDTEKTQTYPTKEGEEKEEHTDVSEKVSACPEETQKEVDSLEGKQKENEAATEAASPRKSRRKSTQSKEKDSDSEWEVKTPLRRSRRRSTRNQDVNDSVVSQKDVTVGNLQVVEESVTGEETPSKGPATPRRKGKRRSSTKLNSASVSDAPVSMIVISEDVQDEAGGCKTEQVDAPVAEETEAEEAEEVENDDVFHGTEETKMEESMDTCSKEVVSSDTGSKCEAEEPESESSNSQKRDKENSTPVRGRRRSTSASCFRTPGLPLSAQRSGRKRRRTESSAVPAHAKSPEEWIKILSSSPMVEMRRRTPKAPRLSEDAVSQTLNFDDIPEIDPALKMEVESNNTDTSKESVIDSSASKNITTTMDTNSDETSKSETATEEEHNVSYFRNLLVSETKRLDDLSDCWTSINKDTPNLSEEVEGQIRTTVGQAHLLIAQRFKQFSGLVDNCEFNTGEKETTCTDLQGFWDMIYFQVGDVHTKFDKLTELKDNNWKVKTKIAPVKRVVIKKKPVAPKPKSGVQSKFAAFRDQMKKQKEAAANSQNEDSASAGEVVKVFDAGFFKVSSPVKSPAPHCEAGSPSKPKIEEKPTVEDKSTLSFSKTPRRKSYLPAVPSPLLNDITPKVPKHRRLSAALVNSAKISGASIASPYGIFTPPNASPLPSKDTVSTTTPKRRSTRLRKSLCLSPAPQTSETTVSEKIDEAGIDPCFFMKQTTPVHCTEDRNVSHGKSTCLSPTLETVEATVSESNDDASIDPSFFMKRTTPAHTAEDYNGSVSKVFRSAQAGMKSGGRKSALKTLPSAQRRRSRRSVQFVTSSGSSPVQHQRLPSTPYNNKDTLVPKRRVSHGTFLFTPPTDDKSGASPMLKGAPRPSLLFTPHSKDSTSTNTAAAEDDNLMAFTP